MDVMQKTYVYIKLIEVLNKIFSIKVLIFTTFSFLLLNSETFPKEEYWNFSNGNFEAHKFSKLKK